MARPVAAWGSLPFAEQIAFFKDKLDLPTQTWQDLLGSAHDRAFVVAGAMRADLLADLHAAVLKAIEKGTTLATFRKDFDAIVAKRGWTGWTGEDTPGGRAWRTNLIYGTNMRTSYQAGRHAQALDIAHRRPYWRWRHADTVAHPRPLHVAWDGKILRYDNPWWQAHWPPAGWNSLLPWERVHGHISLGLKARYSGPIVEIIGDSGGRLCLTSQHPVLTDKGWIAAGDIKEGCNLLRYRFDVDGCAMASCSYDNQPPPRADEIFNTLGLHGSCTMPRAAFNLYGDVKFFNSDVDVVGADRELLEDVKAESAKFRSKIAFMLSDKEIVGKSGIGRFSFPSLKDLAGSVSSKVAHGLHAFTETSFSFALDKHGASIEFNPTLFQMRRQILSADVESCGQLAQGNSGEILVSKIIGNRFPLFNRSLPLPLGKLLKKLFISGPSGDSPQFEISTKRGSPYAIFLGNLIDRFANLIGFGSRYNFLFGKNLSSSSRMVPGIVGYFGKSYFTAGPYRDASIYQSPSYAGGTNPNAFRDVMDAQSSLIEFDRVSKVVVSHYSGPVYDFQTKNGLIISYGGFCVSNCRCRVETLSQSDLERMGKSGPDPTPDDGTYEWLDKAGNSHTIPNGIDPGWDYTPGATRDLIAEVKAKAAGLPDPLGKALVEEIAQAVVTKTIEQAAQEARDDCLAWGKSNSRERLIILDEKTGKELTRSDGDARSVAFSRAAMDILNDGSRSVRLIHNHPSDNSLSTADFEALIYPGVRGIEAAGHGGSRYVALKIGNDLNKAVLTRAIESADRAIRSEIQPSFGGMRLPVEIANWAHHYFLARGLDEAGLIKYQAILTVEKTKQLEPYQWLVDRCIAAAKRAAENAK